MLWQRCPLEAQFPPTSSGEATARERDGTVRCWVGAAQYQPDALETARTP